MSPKSRQNLAKIKQIHPSYHPKIHPSYVSPRRCLRPRRDHKAGVRADRGTGDGAAVTHLAKELRKKWGRWPWGHGEIHGKSRFGKYVWNPSIWVVLFNLFGERFDFKRGNEWARLAVKKMRAISFLPSAYLMGFAADLSCRNQQIENSGYKRIHECPQVYGIRFCGLGPGLFLVPPKKVPGLRPGWQSWDLGFRHDFVIVPTRFTTWEWGIASQSEHVDASTHGWMQLSCKDATVMQKLGTSISLQFEEKHGKTWKNI